MKKSLYIVLALCLGIAAVSCEKAEERWADNENAYVYFPQYGFTVNEIWDYQSGTYPTTIGVYCSGLRPDNQKETISVGYSVDESLVDAYNADITNQYSGKMVALPSDSYTVTGSSVNIPAGDVSAQIPVSFNLAALKAATADTSKRYVIPMKLTSTSKFKLNEEPEFNVMYYSVVVRTPGFYFYCNRNNVVLNSVKVYAEDGTSKGKYEIGATGVPDGNYEIRFAYDEEALKAAYPSAVAIPENAVSFDQSVTYKNERERPQLSVTIDGTQLEFLKEYYLPISIVSAEPYEFAESGKTLFIKAEMKNHYEKQYASVMSVSAEATSRVAAYSAKKNPTSYAADMIELQLATNGTIAGATSAQSSSTTYNNRYVRLKVTPTADQNKYAVEYVLVTDKGTRYNSPDTLEADPDSESYYDWKAERFVLNYRWKHIVRRDTSWVKVSEVLEAN